LIALIQRLLLSLIVFDDKKALNCMYCA